MFHVKHYHNGIVSRETFLKQKKLKGVVIKSDRLQGRIKKPAWLNNNIEDPSKRLFGVLTETDREEKVL